ncbi:MAG TPA: hypothetical protein VHB30_08795 [Solirubrobacteraceae bacterium]|jgi:hypothetical protein|nr:hypothetical protein [Solirubrobacteraceae bacterium]
MSARREPPVLALGVGALVLILIGTIYQVSHLPRSVPLTLPWILVIASGVLLLTAYASVRLVEGFAWSRFLTVGRWLILVYGVLAGLIEYTFIRNHTRGGPLLVLTLSIAIFWLTVPLLISYTVARNVPED